MAGVFLGVFSWSGGPLVYSSYEFIGTSFFFLCLLYNLSNLNYKQRRYSIQLTNASKHLMRFLRSSISLPFSAW